MRTKQTKSSAAGNSKVPKWILDELKRDPGLLDAVTAVVRMYRKRSPAARISRR
jgi:hypothetical protein